MAFLAGKRVFIAGAGVAGTAFALALEQLCKKASISPLPVIRIFEREASPTARAGLGYAFSLHDQADEDSGGLKVVRLLGQGIAQELRQLEEPGNGTHICSDNVKPLLQIRPAKDDSAWLLRISRSRLRQTLLAHVPPGQVQYGKACVSAVAPLHEGAPVQLRFDDGSSAECDLLVVADGANSKIRTSLLPQEKNNYAGVTFLFGRTRPLEQLPEQIQRGHYVSLGRRGIANFMGSVDVDTVMWSLSFKAPPTKAAELNALFKDPAAAQAFLDREVPEMAAGFGEPLPTLLRETPASSLTALPASDKMPHSLHDTGIVYIGDAWHAMSPYSGSGANMALKDAWNLAQLLVAEGHPSAQAALKEFAEKNAARSAGAIDKSHKIIFAAHSTGLLHQCFLALFTTIGFIVRIVSSSTAALRWIRSSVSWSVQSQQASRKHA